MSGDYHEATSLLTISSYVFSNLFANIRRFSFQIGNKTVEAIVSNSSIPETPEGYDRKIEAIATTEISIEENGNNITAVVEYMLENRESMIYSVPVQFKFLDTFKSKWFS